jgi:hypothetical protein
VSEKWELWKREYELTMGYIRQRAEVREVVFGSGLTEWMGNKVRVEGKWKERESEAILDSQEYGKYINEPNRKTNNPPLEKPCRYTFSGAQHFRHIFPQVPAPAGSPRDLVLAALEPQTRLSCSSPHATVRRFFPNEGSSRECKLHKPPSYVLFVASALDGI